MGRKSNRSYSIAFFLITVFLTSTTGFCEEFEHLYFGNFKNLPDNVSSFEIEPDLRPRVMFWVNIYSKYHSWDYVVHDVNYPYLVYDFLDTKKVPKKQIIKMKRDVVRSIKKVNSVFLKNEKDIDKTKAELSGVDLKIFNVFVDSAKLDYLSEAGDLKNIRTQAGLRDGLEDALFISGRYLPRMKDVFKNFGLPEEISYLPFVESGFNKKAVSKVGASGIWQFMPYTGKLYLRVNDVIDERNDPMRAAEAAARLMSGNHKALGKWSLAITAYNHGRAGVANAVKTTGSDKLNEIIENYQSPSFGFASKNFFVCFVGAMYVVKNSDTLIGEIPRAKKLEFDEFVMPHYMSVEDFLTGMDIDLFTFKELNPALTPTVYKGERRIPIGYTVRVPIENREDFLPRYERISKTKKFDTQIEDELGKEKGLASVESSTKTSP